MQLLFAIQIVNFIDYFVATSSMTYMENKKELALQSLGLSEKEAKVYLALLKAGKGSAYAIAEIAGLKKPTTYVILGELIKKGLAFKTPRSHKQLFTPKDPDEVFSAAESKLAQAKSLLPEIKSLANKSKVKTIVYEGVNTLRDSTQYGLKQMKGKELLGFYARSNKDLPEGFMDMAQEWAEKMKENGVTMRGIAPDDPSLKEWRKKDAEYGRTFKVIPNSEYSSLSSIDVGDTFVRIHLNNQAQAVVIENKEFAQMMRQIFEMLWKRI